MDFAAGLSADLSAALEVDVVEDRPETGERHVCVRPVAAKKVESVDIDAVQGPDPNIAYDWFQKTAFACVEGADPAVAPTADSVLVAAPTSAGKTAVAMYAIRRCMAQGRRCVYTAPIKALSNEKFGDFVREFSAEDVALLTGDARAGRLETAKIVVMTTEVLVSLLHNEAMLDEEVEDKSSRSALMQSLSCAIFDEIHYIADEERGTAWEECIILLERHVQLIGLSATVPNFLHLAAWIAQTRHARCHGIFSRRRPVPLVHGVVPCPPATLVEVTAAHGGFKRREYQAAVKSLPKPSEKIDEGDRGKELVKIVEACKEKAQLPLIVFSFSRKEAAKMARQLAPSVKLKDQARRQMQDQLEMVVTKQLKEEDRQLQSIRECQFLLSRGVGLHHGGMLPVLREITEKFFKEGLIRVLCTTETFAVGVNMPSRSIVFNWVAGNEFHKFDGTEQREIFVAEYMQMAGRAGRRTKDKRGNVWNIITRKYPATLVKKFAVSNRIEPVESKFNLSWPLILRCLRSGGGVLSVMCMQNFMQFLTGSASNSIFQEECDQKLEALMSQGYLEESRRLTRKGRAAAFLQVATPALLGYRLLEMPKQLFCRSIIDHLVAFLSCFVNDLEEPEEVQTDDAFDVFWKWCEDELQALDPILKTCDQCTGASLLNQLRRRATFVSATLRWMRGDSFEECSDAAGGSEFDGILARVLRRTHLMLKQLDLAFQLLEETELAGQLREAHQRLHRGGSARQSLPFLESLYLPLSFEPDTLDPSFLRQQEKPCPYKVGEVVQMSPQDIGFSHFSISAHFRNKTSLASTLRQLINREIRKEDIETVQVYWTENKFWCLSNRRLAVFRLYQQFCPEDGALIPVEVVGDERANEWGFWTLWTTGLWRGRRAVLRATSEMIGRTKEETYFFSVDESPAAPEEFSTETGYERAEHPPDMPISMEQDTNAESDGGDQAAEEDAEILEMEEFPVALDGSQVAKFLINRELDEANAASEYAISKNSSSWDLLPARERWDVDVNTPIPDKFGNIHEYMKSFAVPLLEELREDLRGSLDSTQLNLDFSSEAVRLLTFEDAKKMELKLVPLMPPWFRRVPNSQIMVVMNASCTGPARAGAAPPGQMSLLYEDGSLEQIKAISDGLEGSGQTASNFLVQEGGCYRFGLVHTTPKSKYALLLVTQRGELPSCTAFEEKELHYERRSHAICDISLSQFGDKVQWVHPDGKAWGLGVREGMEVMKLEGWDDDGDAVTLVVKGHARRWRLALLQCNVMSALRIASALAEPNQHHPVFWQKQISGNPDRESTVFGSVSEERCAAMRSVEDFAAMGLNQSQADAVNSLVQCPYGVQLVQGPPGTGKTHTLSVLLRECARLALSTEEEAPEMSNHRSRRKEQEEQQRAAKRQRHANRCLVCAPTNIAVKEVLSRMLEKLELKELRAQVTLVATEDRADVKLEDEISDASSVLLDHRKKRIKRMARFWLGEGFVKGKPHLRQPPWAWKAQSALANLIEDLPRAYQKELGSGAVWNPRELLEFLRQRLEMLRGKLINQKARLSEEVALDTEDFPPVIRTKKDQNRLEVEALICQQLCDFRAALEALSNSLQTLLEDFAFKEDELQNFKVEPPSEVEATPSAASAVSEAAPAQNQFLFTEAERKRAYRCVSWTEDSACLEELANILKLSKDEAKDPEKMDAARKRLSMLLHPDKAPEDLKEVATGAFQNLGQAIDAIRKYLELPPLDGSFRPGAPRREAPAGNVVNVVTPHAMLKALLTQETSDLLEKVLEDHAELRRASGKVRTATSTYMKSMLLRRCAVVFCTLTVAGRQTISAQQFPTLLVDEACQACEAETLPALCTTVQRMFLVGDPRQLPATIASPNAKKAGYGRSMFERLELLEMEKNLLDLQYRMEEPILSWSNESFYEQKIRTAECVLQRPDCSEESAVRARHPQEQHRFGPFRLFDTSKQKDWVEKQVRFSFENEGEAKFTLRLLQDFFEICRPPEGMTVGIITPYRAQVDLFERLLEIAAGCLRSPQVTVATVDGFQGNERDIIIISTVRSGGSIGFNADERRLNVAVTRAKHRAWIVGNMDTLYGGQSKGNVWRGLLAFAKLRAWVLPAEPSGSAAAGAAGVQQVKERPLQQEGCYFQKLREEWEEQKEIGYLVERLHDSFWQPFCRLCNKFSDWDHLESSQHKENKQKPWQLLALSTQDEGFLVSLQLSGAEPGFSLRKKGGHLEVCNLEDGSLLAQWNDDVPLTQLPWVAVDRPRVEVGHRILEVEGLVGNQALAMAQRDAHKLRMTVALPGPEDAEDDAEESEPPDVASVDAVEPPSWSEPPWLPLGGPGFRWEALWSGIRGKSGQGTDTEEVCLLNQGDVVVQAANYVRLSNGLVRMPIRTICEDFHRDIWVTLDARGADCATGRLFFRQFAALGSANSLWRVCSARVIIRNGPDLASESCDEIVPGAVVTQAFECQWVDECLRMPIKMGATVGWVTVDARLKGGPLFFEFLAPPTDGRWRALKPARPRAASNLESSVLLPNVKQGDIFFQNGPWKILEDGKVRLPIRRTQGEAWVMLLSEGRAPEAWFELVGMSNARAM